MKFTNGFWLLRDGVFMHHATQIYSLNSLASDCGAKAKFIATPKIIRHRGDTLNIPTFNCEMDSPLDGVIRLHISHHTGGDPALKFNINEQVSNSLVREDENAWHFTTGDLEVTLHKGNQWKIEFRGSGNLLTGLGHKSLAFVTDENKNFYISTQLNLAVGENIYGLGERFTPFIKNGQSIDLWNEDGGTSSEQAYKNIPFYLSNKGYGVFINHTGKISMEVGSEAVERVQFSALTQDLEFMIIYGPTPKEILEKYTALTGRAPVLPEWSFGLWLSTSFVTEYDEKTVSHFIDEMARREIPLSVFHFDCFWMREFQWCDFTWDERTFPEPRQMLSRLKERGVKISLWINPYVGQASSLFNEARDKGYLLTRADGSVWQWDLWQAGNAIVDFTNPAACEWFKSKLRPLLEMGVDCFKTDFGERIPTDVVYANGANPEQMHNLYTLLYNQTVWEVLQEFKGEDAIVFARSATTGSQSMPVHWGGDNTSTFESMAESLRGGLSLSLSGFGYWSHDIGGFEGTPNPDVFKRWVAFGLLSSHSRLHGNESVRVPWSVDEEAVDVTRHFATMKKELTPYIMRVANDVHSSGTPMMRAMLVEFPEDPTCWFLDRQYMFGPDILVAPVFDPNGDVNFYLPHGEWKNYFTGEVVSGGTWRSESHDYFSLPLYVRSDAHYLI